MQHNFFEYIFKENFVLINFRRIKLINAHHKQQQNVIIVWKKFFRFVQISFDEILIVFQAKHTRFSVVTHPDTYLIQFCN